MKTGKIKFGIIGFGAIGPRYKERIEQQTNAGLIAVCDTEESL